MKSRDTLIRLKRFQVEEKRRRAFILFSGMAGVLVAARTLADPQGRERMLATRLLDRAVVMRELMPQDIKPDIDRLSREQAMAIARYLAGVVGRAHGRQLDKAERGEWLSDLSKNHTKLLEAPSWLWSNVVELLSIHELAYLEHCRRFALAQET